MTKHVSAKKLPTAGVCLWDPGMGPLHRVPALSRNGLSQENGLSCGKWLSQQELPPFSIEELEHALRKLKRGKAHDTHGIRA